MIDTPLTTYDAYCNWVSRFMDCKDLNVALIGAFILFLCAQVYKWFSTRRNKKAVGLILIMLIASVTLVVSFPRLVEDFVLAVITFRINFWLLLALLLLGIWAAQKWGIKHKYKIAAVMTGGSDHFIKDGSPLKDYTWKWEVEADPRLSHGKWHEVQLDGRSFYSLTCNVVFPTKQTGRLYFGVKLKATKGFSDDDFRKNAPYDVAVWVNFHDEGMLAKLAVGEHSAARKKLPQPSWLNDGLAERTVQIQIIVNDGANLALMINGQYVFSKPIIKEALKHMVLLAGGDPKKYYTGTIKDIVVLTAKTEADEILERTLRMRPSAEAERQSLQSGDKHPTSRRDLKSVQNVPKPSFELRGPVDANRITKTFDTAPGDILASPEATVTVWVNVTQEMVERKATSYTYILSHASNDGNSIASGPKYGNGWALGLVTGNSRTWRLFISNAKGESPKDLEDRRPLGPGWHLFAVTWSKTRKSVKLYVDGERKATSEMSTWPEVIEDNIFVGTWPNLNSSHFIDTLIASLKFFNQELSADDILREYRLNKPV